MQNRPDRRYAGRGGTGLFGVVLTRGQTSEATAWLNVSDGRITAAALAGSGW